jgi:hypothetical protein
VYPVPVPTLLLGHCRDGTGVGFKEGIGPIVQYEKVMLKEPDVWQSTQASQLKFIAEDLAELPLNLHPMNVMSCTAPLVARPSELM